MKQPVKRPKINPYVKFFVKSWHKLHSPNFQKKNENQEIFTHLHNLTNLFGLLQCGYSIRAKVIRNQSWRKKKKLKSEVWHCGTFRNKQPHHAIRFFCKFNFQEIDFLDILMDVIISTNTNEKTNGVVELYSATFSSPFFNFEFKNRVIHLERTPQIKSFFLRVALWMDYPVSSVLIIQFW